ncbi:hypothetical protein MMC26_001843 [Xylographa opegraphella]|nr:hypothetical protein [Xylographa opegraphella]
MAPHATYALAAHEESFHRQFPLDKSLAIQSQEFSAADPAVGGDERDVDLELREGGEGNVVTLSGMELEELKATVLGFESEPQDSDGHLGAEELTTFPLPTLARRLKEMSATIHGETGHVLIRGINSIPFTYLQKVIAHTGLTSHLAGKRAMSGIEGGDKTVLHHVTALSTAYYAHHEYHAPSNQAGPLLFHTDLGHILSLFTVSQSLTGGEFYLADTRKVWEKLKDRRPDLATTLLDDWAWESPSISKQTERGPIVILHKSQVFMNCSRVRISGTTTRSRPEFLPPLTSQQLEALELLQSVASDVAISFRFQQGDMLVFNNLGMMHARSSFIDQEHSGHKRHLLRLIARNDFAADILPQSFRERLERLYEHEDKDEKFDIFRNPFMFAAGH